MIRLPNALAAWNTPQFESVVKHELEQIDGSKLPLQACLSSTSVALADKLKVMILSVTESGNDIIVKTGVFYAGIDAGCSCANDPTPVEEQPEYCELLFMVDKKTANAAVKPVE